MADGPATPVSVLDEHARLIRRYQESGSHQDLENAIQIGNAALKITSKCDPRWSALACSHASCLADRSKRSCSWDDLQASVTLLQDVNHPPGRPVHLHSLSSATYDVFCRTGVPHELDKAIQYARQAVDSAPRGHPHRAAFLLQLSDFLEQSPASNSLDEAIQFSREALELTGSDSPDSATALHDLAQLLWKRSRRNGALQILEEGLQLGRKSTQLLANDLTRAWYLNDLSLIIADKHYRTGNLQDLEEAIRYSRQAVELATGIDSGDLDDNANMAICLMTLGDHIGRKFEFYTNCAPDDIHEAPDDIHEAVEFASRAMGAVPPTHALRSRILSCLGIQLWRRGTTLRTDENDLTRARHLAEEAVRLGTSDPSDLAQLLRRLSQIIWFEFEETGSREDMERSLQLLEDTLALGLVNYDDFCSTASQLAYCHHKLAVRTGNVCYMSTAVEFLRKSFDACPEGHPGRLDARVNLAFVLHGRFDRLGVMSDLEEAIELARGALQIARQGRYGGLIYSCLGQLLGHRFNRLRRVEDLDEAITVLRGGQPVHGLCVQLCQSFRIRGRRDHLQEAIEKWRDALRSNPDHELKAAYQLSLSGALQSSLEASDSSSVDEWEETVRIGKDALVSLPGDHTDRARMLHNLAHIVERKSRRFWTVPAGEELGIQYCEMALHIATAPPIDRIRAGMHLFNSHKRGGRWKQARAASEHFIYKLLPRLGLRLLPRRDQQYLLQHLTEASSIAAGVVLQDGGSAYEAIKLLEAGRTLIASLKIASRGDASGLAKVDAQLHAEFVYLRDVVSGPSHYESITGADFIKSPVSAQMAERAQLVERLEVIEDKIRSFPGLGWLFPTLEAETLTRLAEQGPIVLFNTAGFRTDALLISAPSITSLPLTIVNADIRAKMKRLVGADQLAVGPRSTTAARQKELRGILEWLWQSAVRPVLTHLGLTTAHPVQPLPRIWWVTSGLLGLAPLHAAGDSEVSASDYVVSSYVANIRSLQYAREMAAKRSLPRDPETLMVAMPRTAGKWRDLATEREEEALSAIMGPGAPPKILRMPTKATVLGALPDCDIVHFACHGVANALNPSAGGLVVGPADDDAVQHLTIEELSGLSRGRAQIAYLSACSTAENASTGLLDEAIHIASTFQLIGFPHVVGTLWEASDSVAPEVAKGFYGALMREARANGGSAEDAVARALWTALRAWRKKRPKDALSWASYVHLGA